MATVAKDNDKLAAEGNAVDVGYVAWKRAKVESGLEQSRDRTSMIPAEQVLRDLTLER